MSILEIAVTYYKWSERFLSIIGWDPSVGKSNQLHVDILQFFLYTVGVYSINSSKMIGNFPTVLNFNWFICNKLPVLPDHSLLWHLDSQRDL